ncbi:ABC transporter substrate-binding protein [Streptococcus parauberis]|uniref:ABC transporter substrate-binding protein n=1 Tax=Streptococcus parauberis TaxID=1348 RepID=UPI000E3048DD|nr:extracellular solute-binding protein [Streptococcus parauberis]RFE01031.1 Multiple sugar-binding protein precursor [Streptococcus parauberis]
MKKWQKILTGIVTVATASTMVACSGGNSSSDGGGKTLTVGYWKGSDTENATFKKLVKNFEKETGATVKPKIYTDITKQMPTDFAGGTAPDVFYMDSSFFPYLEGEGVLAPLTGKGFDKSKFYPTIVSAFESKGKLYGLPKDVSTLAMYINKDIFAKAGISEREIPKSYEEFMKWAPSAQEKIDAAYGKGKVYLLNVNADLTRNWKFITSDNQDPITKSGKIDFNSKIKENLATVQQMFNGGYVATPQQVGAGDEGVGFATGKFAMVETGNWNYQVYKEQYKDLKFEIKPLMSYKGKDMTMQYTVAWGKNKDTKVSKLADKWIQYVTGAEGMGIWTDGTGTLPTRQDVTDNSKTLKERPMLQVHSDQIKNGVTWQDGVNLTTAVTSYGNFITKAFDKDAKPADLEKALKETNKDANSKLTK